MGGCGLSTRRSDINVTKNHITSANVTDGYEEMLMGATGADL